MSRNKHPVKAVTPVKSLPYDVVYTRREPTAHTPGIRSVQETFLISIACSGYDKNNIKVTHNGDCFTAKFYRPETTTLLGGVKHELLHQGVASGDRAVHVEIGSLCDSIGSDATFEVSSQLQDGILYISAKLLCAGPMEKEVQID